VSFKTASAILRGRWLIDKSWTQQHLPLVLKMAKGETVDFGMKKDQSTEAKVLSHKAASVYSVSYYTDLSRLPAGSIAMIDMIGPVTKYGDVCSYGSVDHVATLNRLSNAPNVSAILLNVDSPGGEASGTQMLSDAIKQATKQKPVIGLIDDGMAASAAYWFISSCTEIYTTKNTDEAGSIGAYTTIADWYGYFESEGLKVRDIYAPQSTEKNFGYREALKDQPNDTPIETDLKFLVDEFFAQVQENRGSKLTSDAWKTGKLFNGKEAAKIGLTDGQKSFDQVIRRTNTLIQQKQNSNSNTMAFEKTLSAAKAESFAVVDDGFLLSEENLNSIEAAIAQGETDAASIITLTAELATANTAKETAENSLSTANEKITELEATIVTLGKGDAGKASSTGSAEDPKNGATYANPWDEFRTSVDDEMDDIKALLK
jgi:protease-4